MKSDPDAPPIQPVPLAEDELPAARDGLPAPRRYVAVIAVSLGTILTTIDGTIVNIALPTLSRDLQVSPASAVLVVTIYQLVLLMTLLPFSALGDRFGFRATYQLGQMVFVAATTLCFFARSLPFLVVARGFQALGAAVTLSVSSAMIRSIYPPSRLGRGLSFNTLIAATTASVAPTLGGAILGVASWPWLFAIAVPFGLLSIYIGRRSLPDAKSHSGSYDVLGAVMCAGMLGIASAGLDSAAHGGPLMVTTALILLGAALCFVFVRRERGQTRPIFPVDLLGRKTIALSSIGLLAAYIGSMIVMLILPFRLQQQFHYTPTEAGAVLAPWPLSMMVVAPISGMLSDRVAPGLLGGIGMVIAMGGMIGLAFLPAAPNHFDVIWRIAICGVGFGMFFSPNARQIIGSAPIERAAAAGALASTTRGAGQTLGSSAVAALLASGSGIGSIPALIGAALGLLAGLCSLAVLKPTKGDARPAELPKL